MTLFDAVSLVALSAIWGASFMFMRYLAPRIGPVATADARILIAGLVLVAAFALLRFDLKWRARWRRYLVIGLLNSGLPFLLYSFAALSLPASVEVVLNALSPSFAAIFGALWLGERMSMRKAGGIALGFAGVVVVSGLWKGGSARASIPALLACVAATACYGLAGVYLKRRAKDIEPKAIAAASQLLAGLLIAPAVLAAPPREVPSGATIAIAVVFALLCSALAYLIYYRLIASVGPTKTLTVTFLMPVFGLAWGALFLGESVTVAMLVGAAVILGGTYLVTAREGGSSSRGAAGK